jgi:hypothetical protein
MIYEGYSTDVNEEYGEENTEETGTGIAFDFGRLEHRTVTTSSLTDLYGFPVFSERFTEQVNQSNRVRQEETQESFLRVFTGEREDDLEKFFQAVMQAEPEMVIQADWEVLPPPESPLVMIGFAGIGMVAACFVLLLVGKVRKKRKRS